jgi:hypothetical protein
MIACEAGMSTDIAMLIKLLLILAVCFGFGFQQLWSLRRDKKRTPAASERAAENSEKI